MEHPVARGAQVSLLLVASPTSPLPWEEAPTPVSSFLGCFSEDSRPFLILGMSPSSRVLHRVSISPLPRVILVCTAT